jgi:hypothetical protein
MTGEETLGEMKRNFAPQQRKLSTTGTQTSRQKIRRLEDRRSAQGSRGFTPQAVLSSLAVHTVLHVARFSEYS